MKDQCDETPKRWVRIEVKKRNLQQAADKADLIVLTTTNPRVV